MDADAGTDKPAFRDQKPGTADQVGYGIGTDIRNPLLNRLLNSSLIADLNRELNRALRPELARRLSAVLTLALKSWFGPELRSQLEPGFRTEV